MLPVPLQSRPAILREAKTLGAPSAGVLQINRDVESKAPAVSTVLSQPFNREQFIRHSLLLTFCEGPSLDCLWMRSLTAADWKRLLRWLDLSGLALYFFDRIAKSHCAALLPYEVFESLQKRLVENTQRTRSMIAESIAIQREFQKADLRYSVLKGLSFWPNSVPRPELRLQFDLDFLVADEDLQEARNILVLRGYRPHASKERSWKFIRNEQPGITLKDVYKDNGSWVVELHDVSGSLELASPLLHLEWRELCGFSMPVLSSIDVFLRQGLHAYKDVCSQFFRAALLLEFYRHVLYRSDDDAFWNSLYLEAGQNAEAVLGLGVVTHLIAQVVGEFAPEALTFWTVDRLPRAARLWVETYGRRIVLGSFPGSKLHRLLERGLEGAGYTVKRPLRQSPITSGPPAQAIRDFPNEPLSIRLMRFVRFIRYRMQLDLMPSRLRFYGVEGLRLAWEARRWRRLMRQGAQ
jgi:hypothetical protein